MVTDATNVLFPNGKRAYVLRYDTLEACADRAAAIWTDPRARWCAQAVNPFYGNKSGAEALACLRTGDVKAVARAEAVYNQVTAGLDWSSRKFEAINAPVGATVNIGAYLAGSPANMRMRRRVESDAAPLTIVFDNGVSAGVTLDYLQKRGAAIMALTMFLASTRPVKLLVTSGTRIANSDCFKVVAMPTAPLDLARVAYFLSDAAVNRRLDFAMAQTAHAGVGASEYVQWLWNNNSLQRAYTPAMISHLYGTAPEDMLYIPSGYLGQGGTADGVKDPVQWARMMIEKYRPTDLA